MEIRNIYNTFINFKKKRGRKHYLIFISNDLLKSKFQFMSCLQILFMINFGMDCFFNYLILSNKISFKHDLFFRIIEIF